MTASHPGGPPGPGAAPKGPAGLVALLVVGCALLVVIIVALVVVLSRDTAEVATGSGPTTLPVASTTTTTTTTAVAQPTVTVTAAPAPTAPAPTEPPAPVGLDLDSLSVDGLAPLTLGMSQADASARTGLGTTPSRCGAGEYLTGVPSDVFVVFHDGALRQVFVKNPSVRTPSGLGVGSTVADLERALTGLERKASPYAEMTLYVLRSQDDSRELVFWVQEGQVTSVVAAFGDDGEGEQC